MALQIAVCDDNTIDSGYVMNLLKTWAEERNLPIQTEHFPSAERFLFHYAENKRYDILLLDIEMGTMNGITLAKTIRRDNEAVQIIFLTAYPDYAAEGYDVAALHYLMKPVNPEKLFRVLDQAAAAQKKKSHYILLPYDGEILRLSVDTILYAEALSHSVEIVTENASYEIKKSLSDIQTMLGNGFVACHRSYLVGLHAIWRISKSEVTLDNGKVLPLSRRAAPSVHNAFISFYKGDDHETV